MASQLWYKRHDGEGTLGPYARMAYSLREESGVVISAVLLRKGGYMNEDAKKTALRMIPYGLYVLTAEGRAGLWLQPRSIGSPRLLLHRP